MTEVFQEVVLEGAPISEGIAIGRLFFLDGFQEEIVPEFSIPSTEIEKEVGRYRRAVHLSRDDLHDLQGFLANEGSTEAVSIIDTHIQMLEDPFMTTFMEKKIRQRMKNTEVVFRSVMTDYEKEQTDKTQSRILEEVEAKTQTADGVVMEGTSSLVKTTESSGMSAIEGALRGCRLRKMRFDKSLTSRRRCLKKVSLTFENSFS